MNRERKARAQPFGQYPGAACQLENRAARSDAPDAAREIVGKGLEVGCAVAVVVLGNGSDVACQVVSYSASASVNNARLGTMGFSLTCVTMIYEVDE